VPTNTPTKSSSAKQATKKATKRAPAEKRATASSAGRRAHRPDAIALLKEDHREVEKLFKQFENAGDTSQRTKRRLVDSMTTALTNHAAIEEQVLYPWARDTIDDADDDVLEAYEEHRIVKWLLTELSTTSPADERFDARVTVMIELLRHHVQEEESELFPDVRSVATRSELLDLGDRPRTAKTRAPSVPVRGTLGSVGAAVEHARHVGKDVVDRIGALAGVE